MGLRRWDESRACCEAALESGAAPRITLGLVLAYLGEPDAGEAHLRRALELAETGEETVRAYLHLGELQRVRGDRAGALATMRAGEREAARLGLRASFGRFMYVNAADDLLRLGRWDEAAERLAEAARIDLSRTAVMMRCATLGLLETLRGDFAAPAPRWTRRPTTGFPSEFLAPVAVARAELALAEGDPLAARVHVAGAMTGVQDPFYTPPLYSLGLRAEADLAELARGRRRDPETARADELVAGLDALVTGSDAPPGALAHLALGQAERARLGGARPRRCGVRRRRPSTRWRSRTRPRTRGCGRRRRRCWPAASAPRRWPRSPPRMTPRRAWAHARSPSRPWRSPAAHGSASPRLRQRRPAKTGPASRPARSRLSGCSPTG